MHVVLRVLTGPAAGNNVTLLAGQTVQVGGSEWADFCVADDAALADLHFALACTFKRCSIRDLGSEQGTLVNGEPVSDSPLRSGDKIQAGGTAFTVTIDGEPATSDQLNGDAEAAAPDGPPTEFARVEALTAAEVCQHFDLDEAALVHLSDELTPRQFVDLLIEQEAFLGAIQFLAHAMPARELVWWGTQCLQSADLADLPAPDQAAWQSALTWVKDPTEDNRRQAEKLAKDSRESTPAVCLAWATFFSSGSLTPPDAYAVPPGEFMAAAAASAAILLTANCEDQEESAARFREFTELGCEIADGRQLWEGEHEPE